MKQQRNIRRIDYDAKNTHGWLVQVQREGRRYAKFFSDSVHGGKRKALAGAVAYRDAIRQEKEPAHRKWLRRIVRTNNTSGTPGVGRYARSDTGQEYWCAYWNDLEGKRRERKFSVAKYGERRARQLALETRAKQLRQLGC
ncbi:MAG TPA: AP2 domain-containing protein [Paucimonas sp.]|nr:AP2 domain-containing protein [Paucimonas sp.]